MKKLYLTITAIILLLAFTTVSAFAVTHSELVTYLQSKKVGSYYLELLDQFAEQYDFTNTQREQIKNEADKIITIVSRKNPSFLTSPQKISGEYTKEEWQDIEKSFDNILETANFYKLTARNNQNNGNVATVYDSFDDRLLLTIEVADSPTFEEPSSVPDVTSEESSVPGSSQGSSSVTSSKPDSSASSDEDSSESSSSRTTSDGNATSKPGSTTSSAKEKTDNPKTGDTFPTVPVFLTITLAAVMAVFTKRRGAVNKYENK